MTSISLDHQHLDLGIADDMEISSDRGHDVGDFIEIDDAHTGDDNHEAFDYVNDDLMSDEQTTPTMGAMGIMQDEIASEDEELHDANTLDEDNIYAEEDIHHTEDVILPSGEDVSANPLNFTSGLDLRHETGISENDELEYTEELTDNERVAAEVNDHTLHSSLESSHAEDSQIVQLMVHSTNEVNVPTDQSQTVIIASQKDFDASANQALDHPAHSADQGLDQLGRPETLKQPHVESYPSGEESSGTLIHPVLVDWRREQTYLFAPSNSDSSQTFLLTDCKFAQEPLFDLLRCCRDALGDDIEDGLDLVAYMPSFDITVSDDIVDPPNSTLAGLLDLYLALCQNEGLETPPPFEIHLSTKNNYASRLIHLFEACEQGKGLSEIQMVEEEEEEGYVEEVATFELDDQYDETLYRGDTVPSDNHADNNLKEPLQPPDEIHYESMTQSQPINGHLASEIAEVHSSETTGHVHSNESYGLVNAHEVEDVIPFQGDSITESFLETNVQPNVQPNSTDDGNKHSTSSVQLVNFENNEDSQNRDSIVDVGAERSNTNLVVNGLPTDQHATEDLLEDDLDDLDDGRAEEQDQFISQQAENVAGQPNNDKENKKNVEERDDSEISPPAIVSSERDVQEDDGASEVYLQGDDELVESQSQAVDQCGDRKPVEQHHDLPDEEDLTFSEDDIDPADDLQDAAYDPEELVYDIHDVAHDEQDAEIDATLLIPEHRPSPMSRKRSFREQSHTLDPLEDGGEQKKARPA